MEFSSFIVFKNSTHCVFPAEAGIQVQYNSLNGLDSCLYGNDTMSKPAQTLLYQQPESRQEKAVTTLKMLNKMGCKQIYVKLAGPDPDYQAWLKSKEMNNQMIESLGDLLTAVSEAPQPPEEQPFECVPYDDAPFPLTPIQPEYPAFALRAGVRGTVVLEAEIRKDGTMREVKVKRSIPFLDAAAIEAVRKVRWAPGKRAGQPVDTTVIIPIEFQ